MGLASVITLASLYLTLWYLHNQTCKHKNKFYFLPIGVKNLADVNHIKPAK